MRKIRRFFTFWLMAGISVGYSALAQQDAATSVFARHEQTFAGESRSQIKQDMEQLRRISVESRSPEELIAKKQALLAPRIAADRASLIESVTARPIDSMAMARAVGPASKQMFIALTAIRSLVTSPEVLIEQTQAWAKTYPKNVPAIAVGTPRPDPSNELQSVLYDIRHDAQSPEALIATLQELVRLNPFLLDPNSNPAQK